jgi:hypothetical protein
MGRKYVKDLSYLRGECDKRDRTIYPTQRTFFNDLFDWEEGVSQLLLGPIRLEGESFETYKDRRWVENNLIRFYTSR